MNREKDLKKYNIRTDLLVESIKDNNNIKPVINIEDKIKNRLVCFGGRCA